jgi:hypothetical protein
MPTLTAIENLKEKEDERKKQWVSAALSARASRPKMETDFVT